jgi:hypothetical protein
MFFTEGSQAMNHLRINNLAPPVVGKDDYMRVTFRAREEMTDLDANVGNPHPRLNSATFKAKKQTHLT